MSNATAETAEAVRRALADSGRTKKAVSDETGIPYPTLNRKVAGHSEFTVGELVRIAVATRVPPYQLLPPVFRGGAPTHEETAA